MFRYLIALLLACSSPAFAATAQTFHVGDTAIYAVDTSAMVFTVTSITDEGVWVNLGYSLDAGPGPQDTHLLIDPATLRLKKVMTHGFEQVFPDPDSAQVTYGPEGEIATQAGKFPCSDRKMLWPNGNTDEYWVDSSGRVPIFGYVKIAYGFPNAPTIQLSLIYFKRGG